MTTSFKTLLKGATQGEWAVESVANPDAEYSEGGPESSKGFDAFQVLDAKGRVLFDSINRDPGVSSIMEDHSGDFVDAWDANAKKDAAYIARCSPATMTKVVEALEQAREQAAVIDGAMFTNHRKYYDGILALLDGAKKYLWCLREGDEHHGLFDTIDAAQRDAIEVLTEEGEKQDVDIFDCRPALPTDDTLFEGADEDEGGCDTTQRNWWAGKWVPENIAHKLTFDPLAEPTNHD